MESETSEENLFLGSREKFLCMIGLEVNNSETPNEARGDGGRK